MASITSIHLPSVDIVRFYGLTKVCTVLTAANLRSLFHGRKFLKLLKRRMVDQAVPEIPLSIGSKLELLLSLPNFRILPRILTHLSAYAYCHVYTMYMTEVPRVLHFSAFIRICNTCIYTCSSPAVFQYSSY